jgi:hypothetical protein
MLTPLAILAFVLPVSLADEADLAMVDRLAIETALHREKFTPDQSDMVVAANRADVTLRYDPIFGYQAVSSRPTLEGAWVELRDESKKTSRFARKGKARCVSLDSPTSARSDSESQLMLYRRSAQPFEEESFADLLFARNAEGQKVMTWLAPGEQIVVVEVLHESSGPDRRVEILRRERRLTLNQDARGSEVCLVGR